MAKVTGLTNLNKLMHGITVDAFKAKVKKFVDSMTYYKLFFIKVQQARLVNPYLRDGRTEYPHIRTGNMMRNLIDIKMDRFKESNFKTLPTSMTYTFNTTNELDGGGGKNTVYRKGKSGENFNYAEYLNKGGKRTSRYKGYFGRLQNTFRTNFMAKFRESIINM